ncbi:hypothetical protein QBC37DRAFT_199102 [Rhypophila decipiens]|uniref:Uncharacterized protein n=1 Tax=Rhypophila decipiens TaxID=261697 RepID=A0AAN7BC04_9PEZI|nr:hypothetical protein QBC37DRAFT_199102 [Rhypophila decipiens]
MHDPRRPRDSPAPDWSHTAQNQERSRKRRCLSEDLELAPIVDSGIAKELAGLAAIQLLKSFLVTRRDLRCLDLTPGEAQENHNQRRRVATAAGFSGSLGRGENPWIYGLEQGSDPQYTSPVHRNAVWDIGYDGPQSICSDKSTANNYGDDSTHSAGHKHEWWKPSTVSVRKLASQSEPCLSRNTSWTEQDVERPGEDPGARPMTPSLSRPGNTPPPQKLSPGNISCHNLEHETSVGFQGQTLNAVMPRVTRN